MGYLQWTFSNKMVKGDVRSVGKWGMHGPFSTNGNENISWGYLFWYVTSNSRIVAEIGNWNVFFLASGH